MSLSTVAVSIPFLASTILAASITFSASNILFCSANCSKMEVISSISYSALEISPSNLETSARC